MKEIIKRDGSKEPFEAEKVARVVKAAGLDDRQAQELAAHVAAWVESQPDQAISSLVVRDEVQTQLDSVNRYAAGLFRWYQKTKEENPSK